jgi:hypothetical protein
MPKFRHYSPQLSRELVRRLYHQAKAERIPMTILANRIIEDALGKDKRTNTTTKLENPHITEPN